jgi:hypothetical protein
MKLIHPLLHDRSRTHDKNGFRNLLRVVETSDERDNLDSLAKTHLVSDNATNLLRVELPQPLDTSLLVVEE